MWFFRKKNSNPENASEKVIRCRSLPSAHHFRFAVALCAIHYLCLIAMVTAGILLVMNPNHDASKVLIATTVATTGTWVLALLKRRKTICPLCKGTPLIESGALLHIRARRLPPFTHGVSAILSILVMQRFRCMYCGTDYDLLKEPTLQRLRPKPTLRSFFFKRDDSH